MTEKEKSYKGLWYDANNDKELIEERAEARALQFELNQTNPSEEKWHELFEELLPNVSTTTEFITPVFVDYGYNVFTGENCFFNRNTDFIDSVKINFGNNVFVGSNCGFYTAEHPLDPDDRNAGYELAKEINIGDNVWFGGNVVVLAGVTIGSNTVIGAGSVVTKDIPEGVVAVGNPYRVIREITEGDSIKDKLV